MGITIGDCDYGMLLGILVEDWVLGLGFRIDIGIVHCEQAWRLRQGLDLN